MKSAEQWADEVTHFRSDMRFSDQIKEVQFDAWKQGMTDAAEIANEMREVPTFKNDIVEAGPDIGSAIEIARDSKVQL